MNINLKNSSLLEGTSPIPSVRGSSETQDREEPLPSQMSMAALRANLHYYAVKKEEAFHVHKEALIKYAEAETAFNNALLKKNWKGS